MLALILRFLAFELHMAALTSLARVPGQGNKKALEICIPRPPGSTALEQATLKSTAVLVGTLAVIIWPLQSTHPGIPPSMAGVMLSAEGSCSLHPMVSPMTVWR